MNMGDVALRFHARRTDQGIVIVDGERPDEPLQIRRSFVSVDIDARILRIGQSLVPRPGEDEGRRWIELDVTGVEIGHDDDDSELSNLVAGDFSFENKVLGADELRVVPLAITRATVFDIQVLTLGGRSIFGDFGEPLDTVSARVPEEWRCDESERGNQSRSSRPGTQTSHDETSSAAGHQHEESPRAAATLIWIVDESARAGEVFEALHLEIGLGEPHLSDLIDACAVGRATHLHLACKCYAKSSAGWNFSAREIILSPNEHLRLAVNGAAFWLDLPKGSGETKRLLTTLRRLVQRIGTMPDRKRPRNWFARAIGGLTRRRGITGG